MATSKSKGQDPKSRRLAAERAAEARRRIAEDQKRRRLYLVATAVGVIIVLVAVLIVIKVASDKNGPKSGDQATAADATVAQQVQSVPASVFDAVGVGDAKAGPTTTKGAALTGNGKPRVLYVGAEWCPYCAAERWAMAVALSRFGSFTGLGQVRSAPNDGNLASLTFHGATYTSDYLDFTGAEVQSNQVSGGKYEKLDTLSAGDESLFEKTGKGNFPFIDLGGSLLIPGAQYDPSIISGKDQKQIAAALTSPTSSIGKAIIGSANLTTAGLCTLTANKPAAVCTSKAVTTAAAKLSTG